MVVLVMITIQRTGLREVAELWKAPHGLVAHAIQSYQDCDTNVTYDSASYHHADL